MVSIIAAIGAKNRELGKDNKLLWHIPEDLKRFKEITKGHPVIMGRKTFESIGKPLPNRTNIVISHKRRRLTKLVVAESLKEAIDKGKNALGAEEIFIIGGGQIYRQAIGIADKLYLTVVKGNFEADTFFPDYSMFTKIVFEKAGEFENLKYKFLELER